MPRRPDRAGLALCVVLNIGVLSVLAVPFADTWLSTDEGIYAYQALRILDGQVIYRDFFQMITPLYLFILAGWMKLVGVNVVAPRLCMILIMLLTAVSLHLAGRGLGLPPLLSIVPSVAFATLVSRTNYELNHYPLDLLLEVVTLCLILRYCTSGRRSLLLAAGLMASADTLTTQNMGVHLCAGVALALFFNWGTRRHMDWRGLGCLMAGLLPLPACYAFYAWLTGSFSAMLQCTVYWATSTYRLFDPQDQWFHWIRSKWSLLLGQPGAVTLFDFAVGLCEGLTAPAVVVAVCVWLIVVWKRFGRLTSWQACAGPAGMIAGAMYAAIYAAPNRLLASTSLIGYLLAYAAAYHVYRHWRDAGKHGATAVWAVPGVLALIALSAVPLRTVEVFFNVYRTHHSTVMKTTVTRRGPIRIPASANYGQSDVLAFLSARIPPEGTVYALNWSPWVYYLGAYRNPGPSDYLLPVFTDDRIVEDTIRALERDRTEWLVQDQIIRANLDRGDGRFRSYAGLNFQEWTFNKYRDSHFQIDAVIGSYTIYRRRS